MSVCVWVGVCVSECAWAVQQAARDRLDGKPVFGAVIDVAFGQHMEDVLCWGAVSSRAQWARLGCKTRPWGRASSEKCEVPMTRTSGGE